MTNRVLWKKGLLVDDELKSKTSQENLLNNLKIPPEYVLFAADYEAAIEMLKKHPDIKACIVDVRIPKNDLDFYDYKDDKHPDWGISLLSEINRLNKSAEIEIYSAQVPKDYIKNKIEKCNNIKGFYGKDETRNKRDKIIIKRFRENSFDYLALSDDNANFVKLETQKIKDFYKILIEKVLDIGESLIEVKKRLKHGQFEVWLASEFSMLKNMNIRTAQRYMNAAREFRINCPDNITPELLTQNFVTTAIFTLSESSTSPEAREEAIERAKQGEKISTKVAFELKAKYNSKKKRVSPEIESIESDSQSKDTESQANFNTQLTSASKQQIVKVVRQQNIWQLGRHLLFCGDPNSTEFIKQLPSKIVLNLAFPPHRSWVFSYPYQICSSMSFTSVYQADIDSFFLKQTIEDIIQFTTDENNVATICFLPNSIILQIAHGLGLRCYIAEPDRVKCKNLLTSWEKFESKSK